MPTETHCLEYRIHHSRWSGELTADEIIADQDAGNQLARETNESDYALIIEFAKGVRVPVDMRLAKTVLYREGAQTPLFVVIVGSNSSLKSITSTLQKLFFKTPFIHYADNMDIAVLLARKLLAEFDAKRPE